MLNGNYNTTYYHEYVKYVIELLSSVRKVRGNLPNFESQNWGNFAPNFGGDSAEASAEASVKVAEASVSAESHFRLFRSFTIVYI